MVLCNFGELKKIQKVKKFKKIQNRKNSKDSKLKKYIYVYIKNILITIILIECFLIIE